MISRVAENCFWLNRYIERAETTSRLVAVNRLGILDTDIHEGLRWKPVVVVSGEQKRFEALLGEAGYNDDAKAEEYLTWNPENPASVYSSFAGARENARTTREVVSREMWETINAAWRWLNSPSALRDYRKDSERFHRRIRSTCAEFQGNCHDTMLHEEPFDFLRFGTLVERASQTARVMDVKHHWLLQTADSEYESPQESAQWMGLLRLCSAVEPFFKRHTSAPTGPMVMRFILQDTGFPRSVVHSLDRMCDFVSRINIQTKGGAPTATLRLASAMAERLRETNVGALSAQALHVELTRVIETTAQICVQASEDYFQSGHHSDAAAETGQRSSLQVTV
jgi:uncharacterized alpha-E superfamily protein